RSKRDWSSDVCSSDLDIGDAAAAHQHPPADRLDQLVTPMIQKLHHRILVQIDLLFQKILLDQLLYRLRRFDENCKGLDAWIFSFHLCTSPKLNQNELY